MTMSSMTRRTSWERWGLRLSATSTLAATSGGRAASGTVGHAGEPFGCSVQQRPRVVTRYRAAHIVLGGECDDPLHEIADAVRRRVQGLQVGGPPEAIAAVLAGLPGRL